jgi:hypothetical protein
LLVLATPLRSFVAVPPTEEATLEVMGPTGAGAVPLTAATVDVALLRAPAAR